MSAKHSKYNMLGNTEAVIQLPLKRFPDSSVSSPYAVRKQLSIPLIDLEEHGH